jgi:aryl-phospho-beta-D-glucosidase BglC (GH1 family)
MGNPTGQNLTAEDLGQVKRWGGDVVRLSVSSAFWLRSDCHYDRGYQAAVSAAISAVTAQHVVALVDLHTNTLTGCGKVDRQLMADSTALRFWKEVATRFGSNPLVAFDLYNEPHDISDQVWLSGGPVRATDGTPFQAAGMQQMYDAVRSTGSTNLVVVTGNGFGNDLPSLRVRGSNLVYGVHAYTCPASPDRCTTDRYEPGPILGSWVGADVPVMVTEFGYPDAGSGRFNGNVIDFAQDQGWGWIAFGWDGRDDSAFSLLSTVGPGASYQPSPAGMPVLTALAAG